MAIEKAEGHRANAIPSENVVSGIGKFDVVDLDSLLPQRSDQSPRVLDGDDCVLNAMDDEKRSGFFIDVR